MLAYAERETRIAAETAMARGRARCTHLVVRWIDVVDVVGRDEQDALLHLEALVDLGDHVGEQYLLVACSRHTHKHVQCKALDPEGWRLESERASISRTSSD